MSFGILGNQGRPRVTWWGLVLVMASVMATGGFPGVAHADIVEDIEAAREHSSELYEQAEIANEELNGTNERLAELNSQIAEIEGNIGVERQALRDAMVWQYKTGEIDVLDAMLNANSIESLISGMEYTTKVSRESRTKVSAVNAATKELREARGELEATQAEQQAWADDLAARRQEADDYMASLTQDLRDQLGVNDISAGWGIPDVISSGTDEAWRDVVLTAAYANLGGAYIYGGSNLRACDCSGLVMYCYAKVGVYMGHSSEIQKNYCNKPLSEAVPGDIVYRYGHVGIYIGDGVTIEAHSPNSGISYGSLWNFVSCGSPI